MSKFKLGQAVKSSWEGGAVGVVVYRRDTDESLPAFDEHPDADLYRGMASDDDDFVVLYDETQAEGTSGEVAGALGYGYDDDGDFKAVE